MDVQDVFIRRKQGDLREDGKMFWAYRKDRKGRIWEYWTSPEKFFDLETKQRSYDASRRKKLKQEREQNPNYKLRRPWKGREKGTYLSIKEIRQNINHAATTT